MSQPKFRVVFKDRETGESHKVGTIWDTQFDGLLNFSPVVEPNEEFNEMSFSDALKKYEAKEGFLNVYQNKPKEAQKKGGKKRKGRDEDDLEADFG